MVDTMTWMATTDHKFLWQFFSKFHGSLQRIFIIPRVLYQIPPKWTNSHYSVARLKIPWPVETVVQCDICLWPA